MRSIIANIAAVLVLFLGTSHDLAAQEPRKVGNWAVVEETDPMDDSKRAIAVLEANGENRLRTPALVVRCTGNETDTYINWNNYLGDNRSVTFRYPPQEAVSARWSLSTDQTATFVPQPIGFLRNMVNHERLVARITPYNEGPTTAVFDLDGASEAVGVVAETCGWKLGDAGA